MLRLSKLVLTGVAAAALLATTMLAASAAQGQRWIDVKTGKPVFSPPYVPDSGGNYHVVLPSAGDPNRAFDPETGRNFARENGQWIDVKTGKPVFSPPYVPDSSGKYHVVLPSAGDRNSAFDPETGRNFARDESAPSTPKKPTDTSMNLDPWARDVFAAHNDARDAVGSPRLQWRDDLAEHAQARAAELAQAQQLIHAPREGRGTERENILQAPRGYTAAQEMGRWTREAGDFVPGKFPDVSKTGNWMDVAHYTQMVSIQTTFIGCGHAVGGAFDWVVCRYDPGGNKDGKPVLAEANSQPQLVMREKEAPLPPTDTSRVHQTPMAQPQLDPSVLRWLAEETRRPWNEQPMKPVAQPTAPSESIFDDVGQTMPPPESILDDVGYEPTWGVDVDVVNKYIWRGFNLNDEVSLQPNIWTSAYGFTPAPFTVVLLGEQPTPPTIDLVGDLTGQQAVDRQQCQADFGSAGLSHRLDQAEADLNKKIAAHERIDPADYEKLAAEAEQAKQAAYEADRAAGGGIDPRPFLQNSEKAGRLLKTAEAAAGTKLEAPDLGGTHALIDPNAPSPIELKLSDCVQ